MFKELSRRIVLITLLSVSVFTVGTGIFSYQWAKRTITGEFVEISSNYFQSSNDLLEQYLNYIGETAKMIANNPNLAAAVQSSDRTVAVPRLLDSFAYGMNLDIMGVALYTADGMIYSLSKISNVPPMEELAKAPRIRAFLNDPDQTSLWHSRYRNLSSFYNYQYSKEGTFSFLLKWAASDGSPPGTLVIDLDINKLFSFFVSSNAMFRDNGLFLVRDGTDLVVSSSNPEPDGLNSGILRKISSGTEGSFLLQDREQLYLYSTVMDSNVKVILAIPFRNSLASLSALRWSITLLALLSCLLAVVLAFMVKSSIIRPLTRLYTRMKAFK